MNDLLRLQSALQEEARELLDSTPLMSLLKKLGTPVQTGSSVTGLMVYPDIDFTVQTDTPQLQDALDLIPLLFKSLTVTGVKVADFSVTDPEGPSYYIGVELLFQNKTWHIDATITHPGIIETNPPELAGWIKNMSEDERLTVLELKKELINTKRYVGARSQPPYTFRSSHLYEAVLKGGARTVAEIERYFR